MAGLKSREIGRGGGGGVGGGLRGGRGELGEGGKGAGLCFLPCTSLIIMEGAGLYFLPCTLIIMEGGWLIFSALYFNNYGRGLAYIFCLVL